MRYKLVLTTIVAILLISLMPMDLAVTQDIPTTAGAELDPNDLDFALINDSELWLKSGSTCITPRMLATSGARSVRRRACSSLTC